MSYSVFMFRAPNDGTVDTVMVKDGEVCFLSTGVEFQRQRLLDTPDNVQLWAAEDLTRGLLDRLRIAWAVIKPWRRDDG